MFQVLDPLRLLGHFSFALRQLATQPFNLLLQALFGVPRGAARSRHASDGTPIASPCTDPLNCYLGILKIRPSAWALATDVAVEQHFRNA